MPALKRTVTLEGPPATSLTTRVRRVERIQRMNKPEMKHRDTTLTAAALADGNITLTELTAIAQGSGVADREGASIRIHRVEMRGLTDTSGTDLYLVSPKMNNAPTYGDFQGVTGGFINRDAFIMWWKQISDTHGGLATDAFKAFKYPMKVHYSGAASTGGQRNRIWYVVKNDTGGPIAVEYALRIWYTDQ